MSSYGKQTSGGANASKRSGKNSGNTNGNKSGGKTSGKSGGTSRLKGIYNTEDNRSSFGKQEKIRKRTAIAKGTIDKRTK